MNVFLLDRRRWVQAAAHHFEAWERVEQEIFSGMTPTISTEGIEKAGAYYRVARHFPKPQRRALIKMLEDVAPFEGALDNRFNEFVKSVRGLANRIALHSSVAGRSLRPVSGLSKFLWYRFPMHGFIYDSRVLAAVCRNGLTVRFDSMIDGFGGPPSDDSEWNFMIAASSYRTLALPLHAIVADVLEKHGLQRARAARLIDALFWLEGAGVSFRQPAAASWRTRAAAVGEEAFERCSAILATAIGGP